MLRNLLQHHKSKHKIRQGVKFVMLFSVKQVASRMQTPSLNGIIENSGSNRIANANTKANAQYE